MYMANRLYQVRGTCFNLYTDFVEKADVIGLRMINKSSWLTVLDSL
jgi:hypothetical protein